MKAVKKARIVEHCFGSFARVAQASIFDQGDVRSNDHGLSKLVRGKDNRRSAAA